jgi:photosystem II stability/assembly factor-like uncharacterized protein
MFIPGTHADGALMAQVVYDRAVVYPAGFSGSQAYAQAAATAETVLDVHKNGSNIGTITFAAAGQLGVFALGGETGFIPGDRLAVINENPADATRAVYNRGFTDREVHLRARDPYRVLRPPTRTRVQGITRVAPFLDRHRRGRLHDGVGIEDRVSMYRLSRLNRDRLEGVHPDLI